MDMTLEQHHETVMDKLPDIDEDLFLVMEAAVADDPSVIEAKRRVTDEKMRVIAELCAKDPVFMAARDEYRRTVNKVYIARKENGRPSGTSDDTDMKPDE